MAARQQLLLISAIWFGPSLVEQDQVEPLIYYSEG